MNILVGNTTVYFLPIYFLNDTGYPIFLIILEQFCFFLAGILSIQGCVIIYKVRGFHANMNFILLLLISSYGEGFLGKIMIFPYQKGLIDSNINGTFELWYSKNPSDMPHLENVLDCFWLFLGCFLILHYYVTAVSCILLVTFERSLATYFINDYEKNPRKKLFYACLIICIIFSLVLAILAFYKLSFPMMSIVGCMFMGVPLVGFSYIWYINIRVNKKLNDIHGIPPDYTLAARFQAKENVKSFNFILRALIFVVVGVTAELFCLGVYGPGIESTFGKFVMYAFELINASNPIIVVPILLLNVPVWRQRFLEQLRLARKEERPAAIVKKNSLLETNQYFIQFNKAWQ